MMLIIIAITIAVLANGQAWTKSIELNFDNVSKLPIHAYENKQAKFNFIAIIGGAGLKNKKGRSLKYDELDINIDIFDSEKKKKCLCFNTMYPRRCKKMHKRTNCLCLLERKKCNYINRC